MAETPGVQRADAAELLLLAMQFAVYERNDAGELAAVSRSPPWLLQLVGGSAMEDGSSLTAMFPALEGFLPMAEEFWATGSAERLQSDFWTETDAAGLEYHLLAYAMIFAGRCFLAIERADATYVEHQQLQLYAHEMVMQYETITRLNGEVERANRAKSDFLATMSHEIRTPLNAILGMADLLAESGLTAGQRKYVEVFQRAGGNLLGLINDILDLSKVEAGHLELEAVEFELGEVIGRVLDLTRVKAASKGLAVGFTLAEGLPSVLIGDPLRLRQILLNLLGNAMKFTETGRLTVEVARDTTRQDAGVLVFRVKDTGIGIAAEKLGRIFDNFSQADTSTTRKYGGTGLGLAISKRLVELMGGRIWVESIVGEGSTFLFTARFGVSARTAPAGAQVAAGPAGAVRAGHLLLADDSEDNRFLVAEYLKGSPCRLEFAEDGEIALKKMQTCHFDLVLMDAHMPNMDGYTATRMMRGWESREGRPPVPILALTADAFKESVEESALAGFNAHLTKPISKTTLLGAIQHYALVCEQVDAPEPATMVEVRVDASVAALAPRYLKNMARELKSLLEARDGEDYATIQRIGHNLHGTGTSFGFPRITELGARMEAAAKTHTAPEIGVAVAELAAYLDQVRVVA